jgi:hypothetical protein
MKHYLFEVLIFLRLIDRHDETISITNVALYIVLFKLALVQQASMIDVGSVFVALSNYNIKKYLNKNNIAQAATIATQIVTKSEEISSLS